MLVFVCNVFERKTNNTDAHFSELQGVVSTSNKNLYTSHKLFWCLCIAFFGMVVVTSVKYHSQGDVHKVYSRISVTILRLSRANVRYRDSFNVPTASCPQGTSIGTEY